MKKIKDFFRNLAFMFAFAMKGGDEVIAPTPLEDDNSIVKQEETKNLGEAMLKGEVTQQVKDVRYSTYKVDRESNNYQYVGDGEVVKITKKHADEYKFTQKNTLNCEGVYDTLSNVGKYGKTEQYTYKCVYEWLPKVKIEPYIDYGLIKVTKNEVQITLAFDKLLRKSEDIASYMVLKELEKIKNFKTQYEIDKNDICSGLKIIYFTTYKAQGEYDLISYSLNGLKFISCVDDANFYYLTFTSTNFDIVDLTAKFYSENQERKYQNKETKSVSLNIFEREAYCEECGEKMNVYDADITHATYGKAICVKCLEKMFKNS